MEQARAMQDSGFRCTIMLPEAGPLESRVRGAGVPYTIIRNPQVSVMGAAKWEIPVLLSRRVLYVARLAYWMKRNGCDVAFINTTASIFPGYAARLAGVPIAWQVHEALENPNAVTRRKMQFIEQVARATLYPTEIARSLFPAPRVPRHLVLHNYVDVHACATVQPADLDVEPGAVVICMNGPFRRKGGDIFMDAAVLVAGKAARPVYFLIIGDVDLDNSTFVEEMKRTAEREGIQDRVRWLGVRNDVAAILKRSDVFVSSSRNEARPIIITEAMAIGTPIVSTAVGDCSDMLGHGTMGLLVPPENAEALATAILDCLNDPDAARERAQRAQETVLREYTNEQFWEPLERLLAELSNK